MLEASLPLVEGAILTQRFPRFMRHRDWVAGIRSAFRNSLVFLSAMGVWILSDEPASLIMMIVLPVLFSQMFAASPAPRVVVRKLLSGTLIAIPVAIFFVLVLLAKGSSDFESLMLVLSPPLFLGLMALTSPTLTPYGLGFCLTLTVFVQPSNYMTFAVDQGLSTGLGVAAGLSLLYAGFYLLGPPKSTWLQRRIFKGIYSDLKEMRDKGLPADWLNHRAAERLSYLGAYEPIDPAGRGLTERGLRALATGHRMAFTRNRQSKNIR